MNIWKISIQNLKSKPLYTFLSIFILALSIALLLGIQQLKSSFQHQMDNNLGEIDLVVGAKGSPLQLILASVLHLDNPTGNISYKEAKELAKNPMVKSAVPISYGDNYKGYRIVGTTPEFLSFYKAELQDGRLVKKSMEVVLGSGVAQKTNLKIGDTFKSSHGLIENELDIHEEKLVVVGILKSTQKVIDRLIITNLESVWDVHNHEEHDAHSKENNNAEHHHDQKKENHADHHHEHEEGEEHNHDTEKEHHADHDHLHEHEGDEDHHHDHHAEDHHYDEKHDAEHNHNKEKENHANHHEHEEDEEHHHDHHAEDHEDKEVTSLLLQFRNPSALLTLPRKINKDTNMQAALPKFELDRLYEFTGVGFKTISWIAYLILIISGLTIFISLYKMIKERAFDLAILRTYGATNFQLIKMVAYEGFIIALCAFLLARIGIYFIFNVVKNNFQQNILQELSFQEVFKVGGIVFVMITLSTILAIYPIIKMNISTILSNEK